MQVYKLIALPLFRVGQEIGKAIVGLPKMIGLSNTGYIEWRDRSERLVCDFNDYIIC